MIILQISNNKYIFPLINKTSSYIVYHHKSVNMLYPMLVHNCYINPSLYRVTLAAGTCVYMWLSGYPVIKSWDMGPESKILIFGVEKMSLLQFCFVLHTTQNIICHAPTPPPPPPSKMEGYNPPPPPAPHSLHT